MEYSQSERLIEVLEYLVEVEKEKERDLEVLIEVESKRNELLSNLDLVTLLTQSKKLMLRFC